jgi:hypothetical protein
VRQWPQVQALLCPQCADDALTAKPGPESSLIGERRDRRHEGCRHVHRLSIRWIRSKIAVVRAGGSPNALARPSRATCSGRGPGRPGPPAQIPACGFPAPGSCRRSNAIEVRGFGGPCTPDPQACDFGYTPHPALSPGRALLLAFPPAGRLPSTISATDLWSALFEASLVLCGRPTPHLSRDGFASSASRRGPAPP